MCCISCYVLNQMKISNREPKDCSWTFFSLFAGNIYKKNQISSYLRNMGSKLNDIKKKITEHDLKNS